MLSFRLAYVFADFLKMSAKKYIFFRKRTVLRSGFPLKSNRAKETYTLDFWKQKEKKMIHVALKVTEWRPFAQKPAIRLQGKVAKIVKITTPPYLPLGSL